MKKLLTLAALLGAVTLTFGQGQLTFINSSSTLITTNTAPAGTQGIWTGPSTGNTAPVLGTYTYALLRAPTTVSSITGPNDPNWIFTAALANNTAATSGGRLNGGTPTIPGVASGETSNFAVVGWDTGIGNSYAALLSWYNNGNVATTGWMGISSVGTVALGGGANPLNGLFGANPGQIGGFTLQQINPIPEPSSFALAGLGAAALLIFRRRK